MLLNPARAVITAVILYCGVGDGHFEVFIPVLEGFAIPVVGHLGDVPILPAVAPDVEGLTLRQLLGSGLKEQPL